MTIKKISLILLILTIISLSIFKFSHPQLIPTGKTIIKIIQAQQSISTWRDQQLNEFQVTNKPLSYHATALKIEAVKDLITQIWFESNQSSLSTTDYFKNILNNDAFKEDDFNAHKNQHKIDLIQHYQTILSILYDLEVRKINKEQFNELNAKNIQQLALISNSIHLKLLELAAKSSESNNHQEILAEDILLSYNKLKQQIAPLKISYNYAKSDFRYTLWLRFFSSTLTHKHKHRTLKPPELIRYQSNILSTIFDHIITPNELGLIIRFFIKNYTQIVYPLNYENSHMFQNKPINPTFKNEDNYSSSVISFDSEFRTLLHYFPFKLKQNGDLHIEYVNISKKLDLDNQRKKHIIIPSDLLEKVNNTNLNWQIINIIEKNYRPAILDPIAINLLAERISNYFAFVLSIRKDKQASLQKSTRNLGLNQMLFLQVNPFLNEIKSDHKPIKKNFFNTSHIFKTAIISNPKALYNLGYFYGISSVDLNNDHISDIILPGDFFIDVIIQNKNKYERTRIIESQSEYFLAAYGFDLNSDYKMDIVGIGKSGIYFFLQTKNNQFKLHQKINLPNSFSLCANDIDNDKDIDFYVIRRSNQHSFNEEIIGDTNAIIINNKGTYNLEPINGITSNQIGMSCAIFDINGDNLNDIFITNDFQKNELFIQTENQGFEKLTSTPIIDQITTGASLNILDFNNDSTFDIFISSLNNLSQQISNALPNSRTLLTLYNFSTEAYLNGQQFFIKENDRFINKKHIIFESEIVNWVWGSTFFDYDNDSDKDAYFTTGSYKEDAKNNSKNILMLQQSNQLVHTNSSSKESQPMNSRSAVSTDINNDGKMDILIRNPKAGILYTNSNKTKNNWIKVKLIGKKPNTNAINAIITLRLSSNELTEIILPQTGYLSQEPYIKHFGVGKEAILEIKITWPDQTETTIKGPISLNQLLIIKHPHLTDNSFGI